MNTVFSQLNAVGVYFKHGLIDPTFISTRHLFRSQRSIEKIWHINYVPMQNQERS